MNSVVDRILSWSRLATAVIVGGCLAFLVSLIQIVFHDGEIKTYLPAAKFIYAGWPNEGPQTHRYEYQDYTATLVQPFDSLWVWAVGHEIVIRGNSISRWKVYTKIPLDGIVENYYMKNWGTVIGGDGFTWASELVVDLRIDVGKLVRNFFFIFVMAGFTSWFGLFFSDRQRKKDK